MKTTIIMGAMSVVLLTAVSCSETETDLNTVTGDKNVSLGVSATLQMDGGSRAVTRALVEGTAILYPGGTYADAPGMGVVLTNQAGNDWYDGAMSQYGGHHIWFMGDAAGANWKSIKATNDSYDNATKVPYNLSVVSGQVYAYYPYNAANNNTGVFGQPFNAGTSLLIPVTVNATGNIDATVNNAQQVHTGTWGAGAHRTEKIADPDETDYLYFTGAAGRFVNNGRGEGYPVETAHTDAKNPGFDIDLPMVHGLSMVSFRVYDGGSMSTSALPATFTKLEISNKTGTNFRVGTGKMSLADGTISENATSTAMTRDITNYTLMRQIAIGGTEGVGDFIEDSPNITGATVSKCISAIVYPTNFTQGDIEVKITITRDGKTVVYPVQLPTLNWQANQNYIYTLSAGRNQLTLTNVTVTDWVSVEQDELPL